MYTVANYIVGALGIAITIGLAIAAFLLFWKQINQCKIRMGILCGLVWLLGLLYLSVTFAFVVGNPAVYYGCQYLR